MRFLVSLVVLCAGCAAAGDVTGTPGTLTSFDAPDIAGSYAVAVSTPSDASTFDWLAGDLVVSGSPDALTWDFVEASFSGSADGAFAFDFAGSLPSDPGSEILGSGTVILVDGAWNLDGDVVVEPLAVSFLATQVLP